MVSYEELVQRMYTQYQESTGCSPEDASDLGIRIRLLAGEIYAALASIDWLEKQKDPRYAQGQELDYLAEERGLVRRPALTASGTLQFGVYMAPWVDLKIPAGSLCRAGEEGPAYITLEDAIIKSGTKTASVPAQAVEPGRQGNCAAGAVNQMVTVPSGIGYVTNEAAFTGGDDPETDESLRVRIQEIFINPALGGNVSAYKNTALKHDRVRSASVVPRLEGIGTVSVYLDGREGELSQQDVDEVRAELEKMREIGTKVIVKAAERVVIPLTLQLRLEAGWSLVQAQEVCKTALEEFFRQQEVGRSFRRSALVAALVATGAVWDVVVQAPAYDYVIAASEVAVPGDVLMQEAV